MIDNGQRVFISHISEEAALGGVVKTIIEDVFARDGVRAFLSTDMRDIPAGRKWLTEITGQLDQSRVIVSLLSPTSLIRPWVNIELGAAWIKGLLIIPLCHSGMRVGDLPAPFRQFNGVGLDQDDAPERLLGGIADGLGLVQPKRLAFDAMLQELRHTSAGIKVIDVPARSGEVSLPAPDPAPEQVRILQALAARANVGINHILLNRLAGESNVKPAAFTHHINELSERHFVHIDYLTHGDHEVRLVADGSKWLLENDLMPE
jgi:hypothetical protein